MPDMNLKGAFGKTPESVVACVTRSLEEGFRRETEGKLVKKKMSQLLVAALLIAVIAAGTVLAASGFSVRNLFGYRDDQGNMHENEAVAQLAQPVNQALKGKMVDFDLIDALYDEGGRSYALSWRFTNKSPGETLYVIAENPRFGGEYADPRSMDNMTEFILNEGATEGGAIGELPEGTDSRACDITFYILRAKAEISRFTGADIEDEAEFDRAYEAWMEEVKAEGKIPMEGDGYIAIDQDASDEETTYAQALLKYDKFELVDTFAMNFELEQTPLSAARVYKGEPSFQFDGYELRVGDCVISPASAILRVEYVVNEKLPDDQTGFGPPWIVEFSVPGMEYWTGNSGGELSDPVQLEDGRWMYAYDFRAMELYAQPEQLLMTLTTYDEQGNPTVHEDEAVTLVFG